MTRATDRLDAMKAACRCGAELEVSHPLSGYGGPYDHA